MSYHDVLTAIIKTSLPALSQISNEAYRQKDDPTRWSKIEMLGHLIDSAYNNHQRFMLAGHQDHLRFSGYHQDLWVKRNDYQHRESAEIIRLWSSSNHHLANLLAQLSTEVLTRKTYDHDFDKICMNSLRAGDNTSLSYLVWDYIFHLEHHLSQLLPEYERQLEDYSYY